ncbi:MAG: DUF2156 domain-containing protein [Desulfobulbaceae bacterium]|jgi:hypothetical protein|nr:DUF2156 domain-containing protein [Desulfobulbaceae bacterium]
MRDQVWKDRTVEYLPWADKSGFAASPGTPRLNAPCAAWSKEISFIGVCLFQPAFRLPSFPSKQYPNKDKMLPEYPASVAISLELRDLLQPFFLNVASGVSEHTFANIYLFRHKHGYKLSTLDNGLPIILGQDETRRFFMLPFGIPGHGMLDRLFRDHEMLKCAPAAQAEILEKQGYSVTEDRDNFDYLHRRQDLATLAGRKFHKKRNHIKGFTTNFTCETQPLSDLNLADAMGVLDQWRDHAESEGDYREARDGLEHQKLLDLRGRVYSINGRPVAYAMGEELSDRKTFVIHFEKADISFNGLYQFVNQEFAAALPYHIETINREQDLGEPGLRQAKMSYQPSGFIRKFTVLAAAR